MLRHIYLHSTPIAEQETKTRRKKITPHYLCIYIFYMIYCTYIMLSYINFISWFGSGARSAVSMTAECCFFLGGRKYLVVRNCCHTSHLGFSAKKFLQIPKNSAFSYLSFIRRIEKKVHDQILT